MPSTSSAAANTPPPGYAELHCLSPYSFHRGASHAQELFARAQALGYTALAITDECSLAGIVRALDAQDDTRPTKGEPPAVRLIVGAEFQLEDGPKLVLLCEDHAGYTQLCRVITQGRRRADKGSYRLTRADFAQGLPGTLALWLPDATPDPEHGRWMAQTFAGRCWLAVELHHGPDDRQRLHALTELAGVLELPLVASGDVHMHVRSRRALQDTLTAIRHRASVAEVGDKLFPNGERHLRRREVLAANYPAALMDESLRIAARCTFDLRTINYTYPRELVPEGHSARSWLRHLTEDGMRWRWPEGVPQVIRAQIERELTLIAQLQYEAYFLTVADIVRFARSRQILCQGRGSAANSAVCFALGITEVNPGRIDLLMERFISAERNEPPDIDVDFEHERREEVIQYIYKKYGRERAALAATVIRYRGKSAIRDVARALGLPLDQVNQLSHIFARGQGDTPAHVLLREGGFDPDSPLIRRLLKLTFQLLDFPRHLSQHVGGFVISDAALDSLVPVENAAMPDRTIIQWEKDDLESMRMLKVDCLALGMLTCIRKCLHLLRTERGRDFPTLASLPQDDEPTYEMIRRAETTGVFQIESRAQMAMLPRLQPREFYDLVIQVAIVRPGPIQGNMVHPYLARRHGREPDMWHHPDVAAIFTRTMGVPLFQEQVMKLAIVAAGYTAGEADQLRRSMAAWKRHGGMEPHRQRITAGLLKLGYAEEFAAQLFEQIKGFGSYGFPESHAASFANLVYVSCWLKCHEPAAFACALLNSQPMGFYAPSQIVQELQRVSRVAVRPVDVRYSQWDCTLEDDPRHARGQPALRLGLRMVSGLGEAAGLAITAARDQQPFRDAEDLCLRADLSRPHREALAEAGALRGLAGHRHRARWAVTGVQAQLPLFEGQSSAEAPAALPLPSLAQDTAADYASTGLSLGPHPLRQLRAQLRARRCRDSRQLQYALHGSHVRAAGLVITRQQPGTASGVIFVTMEDEHGPINVIVWQHVASQQRRPLISSRLLMVDGQWQHVGGVRHLLAHRLTDLSDLLGKLQAGSRDFH
ncbi:error-prone DNA polymerase [Dyella sp.]|uniref:error-prone DNA polymerase n=1 Tax=Dyella sp. TaxID=1869338 RepID=UPI002D79D6BC|nr:error-prone DNA polymerase [Dyella sp.]HET6432400.1 error-prone DNA polymerase [Dyella sp.]